MDYRNGCDCTLYLSLHEIYIAKTYAQVLPQVLI